MFGWGKNDFSIFMRNSIIKSGRNEEVFIKKCLCSVKAASKVVPEAVEHIVVPNRCTDRTEEIAVQLGAKVITDDSRNLGLIRNKGVETCKGDFSLPQMRIAK